MRIPDVELLWWAGCPSTDRARAELGDVLEHLGLRDAEVRMTEVVSDEEAYASRFPGSPTIVIDGQDVVPPGPDEPIGLTCRLYLRRDGGISPTPDPADVREALQRALQEVRR